MSINYKDKLKELRPFISFNYDLRKKLHPRQIGKINSYFKELEKVKSQSVQVYRPKSKTKLNKIKETTGLNGKGFKVAFIPTPNPNDKYKIKLDKKGRVVFSNKASEKVFNAFDKVKLVNNPEKEIDRVLKLCVRDVFAVGTEKHEYFQRMENKQRLKEKILELIFSYSNFDEWLLGIWDISRKNQKRIDDEFILKNKFKSLTKREKELFVNSDIKYKIKSKKKKAKKKK